ncbi:unnamed protein product, partial [Effrenium voratum]
MRPGRLGAAAQFAELNKWAAVGDVRAARTAFDELRPCVPPKRQTFLWNTMLKAHAIAGDINGASAHFSAMRSQRVAVTSRTLGKLIRCAAEARRPEQAVQFLEQGSGQGVCESLIAYTSVVDAFAKAGQPVEAEAWLRQMKSKG